MKHRIGIDIGGTHTVMGLINPEGHVEKQTLLYTRDYPEPEPFVSAVVQKLKPWIQELGVTEIDGVGVGAPNGNVYTGCIEFAPNLLWKGIIPLAKWLQEGLSLPCTLSNDANAAAMGEMLYGSARGLRDFIVVTLGTGVGSGFVANGQLICGHDGFAGELGHVIAVREGRACGCGRKGCLEAYASAGGLVQTAIEILADNHTPSSLRNLKQLTARDIYQAAHEGDLLAQNIFRFTGNILGYTLADAIAITSPSAIILFGGVARSGKFLLDPTRESMENNLLKIYQGKVKLLLSELPESDAALLGAAALLG